MIAVRLVVLVAMLAASPSLVAQPAETTALAKQHYERGKQLALASDFRRAYQEFATGYELSHLSPFLFNMGECQRALGDVARARELYDQYLAASPHGDLAVTARARLDELGGPASVAPANPPPPRTPPIPPPEVAAQLVPLPPPSPIVAPAPSLWHRKSIWIGVGVALAAGVVALYATTRHDNECAPPSCVILK